MLQQIADAGKRCITDHAHKRFVVRVGRRMRDQALPVCECFATFLNNQTDTGC